MVDDIIGSEPHTKEGTGWMKMTRHTGTTVHILTNTLQMDRGNITSDVSIRTCTYMYMHVEKNWRILIWQLKGISPNRQISGYIMVSCQLVIMYVG